jgi:SAM-dependent methyltransferase
MSPEFDEYARHYSTLLSDPIRDGFVDDPEFFHERKWLLIRNTLTRLKVNASRMHWLDVGCGQGQLLALAGNYFANAVGCDPSAKMIEHFSSTAVHQQPSSTELPFPDESFDFVTAVCVYHHVHGAARADLTQAIYRVLKPEGIFCVIEHNPWNPITRRIVKRCPVDVDAELLSAAAAGRLLRSASFAVLETDYFLYLPEKLFRSFGALEKAVQKVPAGAQYSVFCRKAGYGLKPA